MMRALADDGGVSALGGTLLIGLTLVLLMMLALVLTATLVVWRVYRRVRRWRGWRGWHRGADTIHPRAMMPGPGRDVARLRRDLREEVQAADVMLSRAKDGRLFIADARALLDQLKINAAAVDADLASIQDYTDTTHQRRALEALRPQVAKLIQTSYLARQTMLETEIADRERHVTGLSEHVERQAAAVKIYRQGAHGLDLADPDGNVVNPSDSQTAGPASNPSLPPGKSWPSWGSAGTR
jgi:hypothetical protein